MATELEPRPAKGGMNGLVLLLLLIFLGMGVTSAYYQWKAPKLIAERRALLAKESLEGEPRLERWLEVNGALVHQRLLQLRISPRTPWLVTHAVLSADPAQPPELWGVDLTDLSVDWSRREGMQIVVDLPPARSLGREWIPHDRELYVPKVAVGQPPPDEVESAARARAIAEHALEPLIAAIPKDIPGAELAVRVGGAAPAQGAAR